MEYGIVDTAPQPVLYVRARSRVEDMPQLIGETYSRIGSYLQSLGEAAAGEPYTAYHSLDMQDLDVEIGFPTARPLPGKGGIRSGEIPAGRAVSHLYKGNSAGMEPVYNDIFAWLAKQGEEPTGVYYEYYLNSPAEVPESELLTRMVIPLKPRDGAH